MNVERSDILQNALDSIELGMDDFELGEHKRIVSAVRNFYAGVLLLGKECLVRSVPGENGMHIISSRYTPFIDEGDSKLKYRPVGTKTIDIEEMKSRFRDFGLKWPESNINNLQRLRNNLEHFHAKESTSQMREIIKECFPIIENFFEILGLDPSREISDAWSTMLKEKEFFNDVQGKCIKSFASIEFPVELDFSNLKCEICESSLIYQADESNKYLSDVELKCKSCGEDYVAPHGFPRMVVDQLCGADDYNSVKGSGEGVIFDCNSCGEDTYVSTSDVNICFFCEESVGGECVRCGDGLGIENQSINNPSSCDYCDHMMSKDD
ncbi:MAG: hypothetical protein CME71_05035 [Halobacteriovorax sp.]|nr:hypothetical protein [Halobacteriovorax sp.]